MRCNICPRACNVNRSDKKGFCGAGWNPVIARAFLHMWEEPCISGSTGSGTVFFSGCNLKCIYCQNHEISHNVHGKEMTEDELSKLFLSLKEKGAHNINLVTPTHYIPAICNALSLARAGAAGLYIPVIYNTSAYESREGLKMLEGNIDIYLPDLKYISSDMAREYSGSENYFEHASMAILEMYRQVGAPVFNENGLVQRGTIIRHLVLPGHTCETLRVLEWIAENLPKDIYVSLMSQYVPCYLAGNHPVIGRRITRYEYEKVTNKMARLGLNGFVQERESASEQFIPDFNIIQF